MKNKVNRSKLFSALAVLIIMVTAGGMGYIGGYYAATGIFPQFFSVSESIAPPSELTTVTASEVEDTLAPLRDKDYGEGYNCVDYAWEAMRLLRWQGQASVIVKLDLDPDPDHAILLVPTEDEGWVFIEPQTASIVYPTVGGHYQIYQTIKAIDIMVLEWIPYDAYTGGLNDDS